MEILDIRTNGDNIYNPILMFDDKIVCEKIKRVGYKFPDHRVFGYYLYNKKSKKLKSISKNVKNLYKGVVYSKHVEGENSVYYVTRERKMYEDLYTVYKIELGKGEKEKDIFHFTMDNKYPDIIVECLSEEYICVFAKEPKKLDFDMKMKVEEKQYGFDVGYVYHIDSGERYEIKDRYFLRSLSEVIFKTGIGEEQCIVYEENYLQTWEKEDIYNTLKKIEPEDVEEKFYYKDSLKVISLEKFIESVKMGEENIDFYEIASRGYQGYTMFLGVDKDNIYFIAKDFEKTNEEMLVVLDRKTMKRKVYTITDSTTIDEKTGDLINYIKILYDVDSKYKGIFATKYVEENLYYVKEVMNGEVEYTYQNDLGYVRGRMGNKYLIAYNEASWNQAYTNIIDMDNNKVKRYKGRFKIFDDTLVLF